MLGKASLSLHRWEQAIEHMEQALAIQPDMAHAFLGLAQARFGQGRLAQAVEHIDKAYALLPDSDEILSRYITIRARARRFDGIREKCRQLIELNSSNASLYTLVGNKLAELGHFDEAEQHFKKALMLDDRNVLAFSSLVFNLHYNPSHSADDIRSQIIHWGRKLTAAGERFFKHSTEGEPRKRLRLGLVSAGLRSHPVGLMITTVLEALPVEAFEIVAYPTNDFEDPVTARLKQCVQYWSPIAPLDAETFAQKIRADEIDILIDLSGHGDGNRLDTLVKKPAPLIVKWVGGLVNTTGLEAIDYLLSDNVETPPGSDEAYLEKLIRMPDDYICYMPPKYAPEIKPLPALANGYVTFGCFNNPAKINKILLDEWARLLNALPESRLLLKGAQYDDPDFCARIRATLTQWDIADYRIVLEGPAKHTEFLEAYNRVDIALDPWPYSGGLTTCEAMLMGVPVVTLPGPTFAGRHAATHLVNAGMPELVTDSWDEYRQRALGLANDLQSLSTIRTHLRDILLQSPVCDGPRFAKHFTIAMRAIWQRYCEGKAPAALSLDRKGAAQFENEAQPVKILYPEPINSSESEFSWQFEGKITVLDNGATLASAPDAAKLLKLGAFAVIAFDPSSKLTNAEQLQTAGEFHHYPHVVLGDGNPATLYACLNPLMSATLRPLQSFKMLSGKEEAPKVLTELPISTIQLDKIEGLEAIDWLILDNMNDSLAVLEHGEKALVNTLLVQARVNFQPTHENQPELTLISHWMARHGFSFYRLNEPEHLSHLTKRDDLIQQQATQLVSAEAIYVPNAERMAALTDNQRMRLAFVLHTAYGIKDLAYELISQVDKEKSEHYLMDEGLVKIERINHSRGEGVKGKHTESPKSQSESFKIPNAPFMSNKEADLFLRLVKQASRYFEFGSGGSTVWAVEQNLTVCGVESDAKWVNALRNKLGERCQVQAIDIGPTRDWGFPVSTDRKKDFPNYSRAIHDIDTAFDLILVDGRFRVACTVAAIQHILIYHEDSDSARIFIHDFWNRPHYHIVLEFLDSVEVVETAGVFRVKKNLDVERLNVLWEQYAYNPS